MNSETRVAILGAGGRMGRALIQILAETEGARLSAALEYEGNPLIGHDAGIAAGLAANGVSIGSDIGAAFAAADVAIDFSSPQATCKHAKAAAERGVPLVV